MIQQRDLGWTKYFPLAILYYCQLASNGDTEQAEIYAVYIMLLEEVKKKLEDPLFSFQEEGGEDK